MKNKTHGFLYRLMVLLLAFGIVFSAGACSARPVDPAENVQTAQLPSLEEILEPATRIWRYTDDPAQLAQIQDTSWTALDFDDTGWLRAAGSFGAKNGKLEPLSEEFSPTVCLRHYEPTGEAIPVYYLRLVFEADAEDRTTPLMAGIACDDAVIIYLNGEAVFSCNAPEDGYSSPGDYGCEGIYADPVREVFTLDTSLLKEGANVLAVELHQANETSTDIYFSMGSLRAGITAETENKVPQATLQNDTLCLGVGAGSTDMLVTWQGPIGYEAYVQVSKADGSASFGYPAQAVYPDEETGLCTYRAVLTELTPGDYFYRTVDKLISDTFSFHVSEESDRFAFLCHGDPQICSDEDWTALEAYQSLSDYMTGFAIPLFVLSLGDQSDDGGDPALFRFFTRAPLLKSVPLAAIVGNHERKDDQFSRFFYLPNVDASTEGASGDMSGDYWFFRNNTLFLCLNSNNRDVDAHTEFMLAARRECEAIHGSPVWTVAALHYSFFSAGIHATDENIATKRDVYAAAFQVAGVDVVFSGHDHSYTRSYPMNGSQPEREGVPGIVYFTLGSSTGSKMYALNDRPFDYTAFAMDGEYPAMTRVDVAADTMTITTYQDKDGEIELLDTYTITKSK